MRTHRSWNLAACLVLSSLLLVMGCGDDDENVTGPTANAGVPDEIVEVQAESSAAFAIELVSSVERLASVSSQDDLVGLGGGFTLARRAAEPVESIAYADGTWNYSFATAASEGGFSIGVDFAATLQYLDALGEPHPFPGESTSSMSYVVDALYELGIEFEDPDTGGVASVSTQVGATQDVVVEGFLTSVLAVKGTGRQTVDVTENSDARRGSYRLEMEWDIDVDVPRDGGCPTGTATSTFGDWRIVVVFDGGNVATWELQRGATIVGSGSQDLECGPSIETAR